MKNEHKHRLDHDHGPEHDDEHFGGRGMRGARAMSSTLNSTMLADHEARIPMPATTLQMQVTTAAGGIRRWTQRPLWLIGTIAGLVAAIANVSIAAAARGLDVSLKGTVPGSHGAESIPLSAFATLTLVGAVAGILLAAASSRWAKHPRRRFVGLAVLGTVVSFVPDAMSAADTATMLTLWVTHIVAAAIIVSSLAARLSVSTGR
jgi:hypothetical protein